MLTEEIKAVKSVWDLTPEQIDYVFKNLHMNNYIRTGLLMVKDSQWPRQGTWRIAPGIFTEEFGLAVDELLSFVNEVSHSKDSRATRLSMTQAVYELYRDMPDFEPAQMPDVMRLFASLLFIVLVGENNDRLPLWGHPLVRKLFPEQKSEFAQMLEPFTLESICDNFSEKMRKERGCDPERPITYLFGIVTKLVQTIIFLTENGVLPELASKAYRNLDNAMIEFEDKHALGGRPGMTLNMAAHGQMRYRNTLYLYGGQHFERTGDTETAIDWYLRDIDSDDLPGEMGFYMTGFKTCERLLCAYHLADEKKKETLRGLVNATIASTLAQTRDYSTTLLKILDENPGVNLAVPKYKIGNRTWFFGNESTREPMMIGALYREFVEGVSYAQTDYSLLVSDREPYRRRQKTLWSRKKPGGDRPVPQFEDPGIKKDFPIFDQVSDRVNDYINGYEKANNPLVDPNWLDTTLDIYIPIVFNGKLIRDAHVRSLEKQNTRLQLFPSFEGELVLDIGCNTGFITYHIAKTAKRVIGIDNNETTLYIPKRILNNPHNEIRNVEFHNAYLEWVATRQWARKYFDSVVHLSILDIDRIERLMPQLTLMAKHRVILEPTNYKSQTPEQILDHCSQVLGKYGRVEFLGNTDYQGRSMFAVYLR